jgi:hypothetical protein
MTRTLADVPPLIVPSIAFADATARLAASVTVHHVGMCALQVDNGIVYMLRSTSPLVWVPLTGTPITPETTTARTLGLVDIQTLIRCTNASDVNITFPSNASVALPIGSGGKLHQGGTGLLHMVIAGGSGVGIARPSTLTTVGQGATVEWLKIDTNDFLVTGDLA